MIRARILKRAGDSIGAVLAMEEARSLDLQDRFLNTKAAKYLFRDGQIEEANGVLGLFTKVFADAARDHTSSTLTLLWFIERRRHAWRRSGRDAIPLLHVRRRKRLPVSRETLHVSETISGCGQSRSIPVHSESLC